MGESVGDGSCRSGGPVRIFGEVILPGLACGGEARALHWVRRPSMCSARCGVERVCRCAGAAHGLSWVHSVVSRHWYGVGLSRLLGDARVFRWVSLLSLLCFAGSVALLRISCGCGFELSCRLVVVSIMLAPTAGRTFPSPSSSVWLRG